MPAGLELAEGHERQSEEGEAEGRDGDSFHIGRWKNGSGEGGGEVVGRPFSGAAHAFHNRLLVVVSLIPVVSAPSSAPSAPSAPGCGSHFVHLGGLEVFIAQLLGQAELLVGFVLFWSTDISLVMFEVRKDVVGFASVSDSGHFVCGKGG